MFIDKTFVIEMQKDPVIIEEQKKEIIKGPNAISINGLRNNEEKIDGKKYSLNIGYFEYISHIFGSPFGLGSLPIKKVQSIFSKEIDIKRIIKKLQDIEKLKLILLNEDQLILFNSISKPMLKIYQEEVEEKESKSYRNSLFDLNVSVHDRKGDFETNLRAFENVANKKGGEEGKINSRLLRLINKNLRRKASKSLKSKNEE